MSFTSDLAGPALWLTSLVVGFGYLADYGATPGRHATAPELWPPASGLARVADRPTIVMLAHACCPCTRASLTELERIMVLAKGRATVHVLMFDPRGRQGGWGETDLWSTAQSIPGVATTGDASGLEARLFGASTSGQVVLYDAEGRLQFSGGITPSRGHAGDSVGQRALLARLGAGARPLETTPVYGCSMTGPCCPQPHQVP